MPELAEAASRTGDMALVEAARGWMSERTGVPASEWALGIEVRVRALLSEGEVADSLYRESIARLGRPACASSWDASLPLPESVFAPAGVTERTALADGDVRGIVVRPARIARCPTGSPVSSASCRSAHQATGRLFRPMSATQPPARGPDRPRWRPTTPAGGYARWVLAVKTRACLGVIVTAMGVERSPGASTLETNIGKKANRA